jgi:hypothetical protein
MTAHGGGLMIAITPLSRFAHEPMEDDEPDEGHLNRESHDSRPDLIGEIHQGLRRRDQEAVHKAAKLARTFTAMAQCLQGMTQAAQRGDADRLQFYYTKCCELADDEDRTGKPNQDD